MEGGDFERRCERTIGDAVTGDGGSRAVISISFRVGKAEFRAQVGETSQNRARGSGCRGSQGCWIKPPAVISADGRAEHSSLKADCGAEDRIIDPEFRPGRLCRADGVRPDGNSCEGALPRASQMREEAADLKNSRLSFHRKAIVNGVVACQMAQRPIAFHPGEKTRKSQGESLSRPDGLTLDTVCRCVMQKTVRIGRKKEPSRPQIRPWKPQSRIAGETLPVRDNGNRRLPSTARIFVGIIMGTRFRRQADHSLVRSKLRGRPLGMSVQILNIDVEGPAKSESDAKGTGGNFDLCETTDRGPEPVLFPFLGLVSA